jgi:hypothetical protein
MALATIFSPSNLSPSESLSELLDGIRYSYPFALLVIFGVVLTSHSILTSEQADKRKKSKSRPQTPSTDDHLSIDNNGKRQKVDDRPRLFTRFITHTAPLTPLLNQVFLGLLILICMSLVGNAVNVIIHALVVRGWWCGQAYVVSPHLFLTLTLTKDELK